MILSQQRGEMDNKINVPNESHNKKGGKQRKKEFS